MGGRAENPCWRRKSAEGREVVRGVQDKRGVARGRKDKGVLSPGREGAPGEWNQVNRGSL